MKSTVRHLMGFTALGLAGCGVFGGSSNATYYKAAVGQESNPTGTDCPGVPTTVVTLTGIDGDGTIAIYNQPNSQYVLDLGAGSNGNEEGLNGTLASGTYTFAGSEINDQKGTTEVIATTKTTITMTPTGPGFTGTVTTENICTSSDGKSCNSNDGADFDCTQQAPVLGTQVTGVAQESPQAPSL
jgi:hypothetical protein